MEQQSEKNYKNMIYLLNNCSEQQIIKFAKNDPQFSKVEINNSTRQFPNSCPLAQSKKLPKMQISCRDGQFAKKLSWTTKCKMSKK